MLWLFIFPSISNGIARANVELANLKIKWQFSCVMFVVGYKPRLAVFTSFTKTKWPMLENLSATRHKDGYFLVSVALRLMSI